MPGASAWLCGTHQPRGAYGLPVSEDRAYNPATRMRSQSSLPRRRSIRLRILDYSEPHSYFITICSQDKRPIFGTVVAGDVALTKIGQIVEACWREIPSHFPNVELATHIVMPEHLHGILRLHERMADGGSIAKVFRRARHAVPLQRQGREFAVPAVASIPTIVGAFKGAATRRVIEAIGKSKPIWQRGYYERVIRDEDEFRKTCEYIRANPVRRALREGCS
jgi:putative transposase